MPSDWLADFCVAWLAVWTCARAGDSAAGDRGRPTEERYGWRIYGTDGGCDLPRIDAADLSRNRFQAEFERSHPVVITGLQEARNREFRERSARGRLLAEWGDRRIVLSTANTSSYRKRTATLREYIEESVDATDVDADSKGSETWYWFGDNDHGEWSEFFDAYELPPFAERSQAALSFGIAAPLSGVPFHTHGRVFAETIVGRKRWFLHPPDQAPLFDGDETTATWLARSESQDFQVRPTQRALDCTVHESEVLYIPADWWHATLNLDQTVFISAFIDDSTSDRLFSGLDPTPNQPKP